MTLGGFLVLIGVLLAFVAVWYGLSYLFSSTMTDPDAHARITGNCGDTMELAFKIRQDRIVETHAWTDGCATSRSCVDAAARLAYGKEVQRLAKVTMMDVIEEVGSLPESHLHCAQLAETTMQQAIKNYLKDQQRRANSPEKAAPQQTAGERGEERRI